jgi:signal transduction histidine kinase
VPVIASELRRARWRPRRGPTLRLRLTLLYGACFLAAGAALLAITYELVRNSTTLNAPIEVSARVISAGPVPQPPKGLAHGTLFLSRKAPAGGFSVAIQQYGEQVTAFAASAQQQLQSARRKVTKVVRDAVVKQHDKQLAALLTKSGVALGIMALLSIGLGWVMAGRALRPLRTMNVRARAITEDSLHERLALERRGDELGELAETFDALLARLERAFESQRRFVANASHELRTPVTLERALVEVALADPDASIESLRECCGRVLAAGEHQERLIEALLTLARSQGGIEVREPVDLGSVARELVGQRRERDGSGVELRTVLEPATASGDRALIERLIANLLDNAVAYNVPSGGWVELRTGISDGRATLRVANSGGPVPPDRVPELFEPFRRLDGERLSGGRGVGLGLSIVSAIATAHRAELRARPLPGGGLDLEVSFPAAALGPPPAAAVRWVAGGSCGRSTLRADGSATRFVAGQGWHHR